MGLSHTVSGDIAHFRTPSRVPIESLKFHFLPKQEGSGDPSPSNVRPITGWTGLNGTRSKKNLCHVTGYSAINNAENQSRALTNSYGTTINTTDFSLPDTDVIITQSEYDTTVAASHYKNGYISIHNDNLIYGQYYDVSIKVSNIVSNPLNAELSNFRIYDGSGGNAKGPSEVRNNVIIFRNIEYKKHATSDKRLFEFRICGMSFTLSEFMVTPANTSDGVFEPFSSSTIPITFPDGQTIYGGYYDPVLGEIVEEWGYHIYDGTETEIRVNYRSPARDAALMLYAKSGILPLNSSGDTICNILKTTNNSHGLNTTYARPSSSGLILDFARESICNLTSEEFQALTDAQMVDIVMDFLADLYENGTPMISYYKLATPIHIPIAPQDLKAYLDHNNFWSDANDITEVTYAVTESKDILETRKKAATFEAGHHKICEWNQLQMDGNFTDISKWEIGNNYGTMSFSNNIGTWTCTTQPTQFYQTGIRIKNGSNNSNFLHIPWNHKVLVRGYVRCSMSSRIRIYGLIGSYGNTYVYHYNYENANLPANEWVKLFGFISDRPETPPGSADDVVIKRFRATLFGTSGTISTITVGTTLEMKNFMAFDLTQMFGLGNEPSTVEEFERICRINGIDLDTYQPYDEGSNRWLTLP